jgi:hypothetical protein
MTLCGNRSVKCSKYPGRFHSYHFKSPDPSNPHLDLSINAFNIIQVNTLPPASTSGLSPEKQELLGHSDGIVI